MPFHLDPNIRLSDLVSTLSFVLAILALLYSLYKDRVVRQRDQVAQARAILSEALSKLMRWGEVTAAIFRDVQATIIATTEIWGEDGDTIKARDFSWKTISNQEAEVENHLLGEEILGAYVSLYRLDSDLSNVMRQTIEELESARSATWWDILIKTQEAILKFRRSSGERITAEMGNELREAVEQLRIGFLAKTMDIQRGLRDRIVSSLSRTDRELLEAIDSRKFG
jgi:hypothetical protein